MTHSNPVETKNIETATDALNVFLMEYPVYQQLLNPASLAYNGMRFEDKPKKVRLKEGDTLAFVATGVRDASQKNDPKTPKDTLIVPVVRTISPIIETAEKVQYVI